MANELTLTLKAVFAKSGTSITFPDAAAQEISVTVSGTKFVHNRQSIGTSEEAIALGEVSTGGYFIGINRDATNYLEIRSGTGGTDLVRLNAGEVCCFRMSGDSSAPFAIANTAACELEYILWSN